MTNLRGIWGFLCAEYHMKCFTYTIPFKSVTQVPLLMCWIKSLTFVYYVSGRVMISSFLKRWSFNNLTSFRHLGYFRDSKRRWTCPNLLIVPVKFGRESYVSKVSIPQESKCQIFKNPVWDSSKANSRRPMWWINILAVWANNQAKANETSLISWSKISFVEIMRL